LNTNFSFAQEFTGKNLKSKAMALAVVNYPTFTQTDFQWIQVDFC
jgi:hypothetical protein